MAPGLGNDQYNSLFVLHRDKGNTEIHFVFPSTLIPCGRRLNIHPPGPKNLALYQSFTQVVNQELGYKQVIANPLQAAMARAKRRMPGHPNNDQAQQLLTAEVVREIRSERVADRDGLCAYLENDLGVTITRKGENYLSVRMPDAKKAIRLRGPLFEAGANYRSLLAASNIGGSVMLTDPQEHQAQPRLQILVQERRNFNEKAYASRSTLQRAKINQAAKTTSEKGQITTKTREKSMSLKFTRKIIDDAMSAARASDQERSFPKVNDAVAVSDGIKATRQKAAPALASSEPSRAMDAINEIQIAIAHLQVSLDAALADLANAASPSERRKAQERVARLMEQMARLGQQLRAAKVRQVNEPACPRALKL